MIYQEAVSFTTGMNFMPILMRLRPPAQKNDVTLYLLSDSFEYDIELIKRLPSPKNDYKNIIIPYRIIDKIGVKPFRFNMPINNYNEKINYIVKQNLIPRITPIRYPYPKKIEDNLYIPMSELLLAIQTNFRMLSRKYIQDNIFKLVTQIFNLFNFSTEKVLIIDTKRYHIYKNPSMETYQTDLINALLTAYLYNSQESIQRIPMIILFKCDRCDYKFDLRYWTKQDEQRYRKMLDVIGIEFKSNNTNISDGDENVTDIDITDIENDDIDEYNKIDDANDVTIDDDNDDDNDDETETIDDETALLQRRNNTSTKSIMSTLSKLSVKYNKTLDMVEAVDDEDVDNLNNKKLYRAKTLKINSELLKRINPATDVVNSYQTISNELTENENTPVENDIIKTAAKNMNDVEVSNNQDVLNTTTSAREQKIREQVGRVKLNNITFDTLTSITDVPLPKAEIPNKLTTINKSTLQGSRFANATKEYEAKLMDRDIVATFMHLSKLPNGFYVHNVEVTDISTVMSVMNNWKVTLKNKANDRQQVINIRIPKVNNGRFFYNGIQYNIGKQDFPIPVLKINKKTVIVTSNYNKITVSRYDTRSLVDLTKFVKLVNNITKRMGNNKYIIPGSNTIINSSYVSTIEYDEYASKWFLFKNDEANIEVCFNRHECLKRYSFVLTKPNEFCCGMINKVPIILNTESGLSTDNRTLTDIMLQSMPADLQSEYMKIKSGKMAMFSEITIGVKIPLGVAISAWEGITSLLKKSNVKYQIVDKSFNDTHYITIPFKDKVLAIQNSTPNQLLFNGFNRITTKNFLFSDFDVPIMNSNSIYVDIFNQLFFTQYSQLTTFITYYNFFIDAITYDVCEHYNLPNDIAALLIYASSLLADNNFSSEHNASLYRVRSSEIIPAMIHYHLAFAISKFNNTVGSQARENKLQWNPNCIIKELTDQPNVSPSSALNPFIELHEKEVITKKGFRGVNNDRAYSLPKRSYEDSMIGKMGMSTNNSANVGINRQLTIDPKINSVRGYTSTKTIDDEYNDLQLGSFSELLTPASVTRDDSIRTAIATSQTGHIVPTDISQPALISNGVDEIVPSYLSDEFSVVAQEDGQVIDMDNNFMIIQYKSGKKQAINISSKYSFNSGSGFYVDNKLLTNFEVNDKFKKNDVLAYHHRFFNKDSTGQIRLNIGPLAKVAFTGTYSTYEDAGIITKKMSDKLTTHLTMVGQYKLNATDDVESIVKVGDEVEVGDPLIVFGLGDTEDKAVNNFLKAFQTNKNGDENTISQMKRVIKAKDAGTVVAVKMYTIKSMDKLSPSLFNIFNNYFKENIKKRKILDKHDRTNSVYKMDMLYDEPTEPLKGNTIKGITCDILIEIYIEHEDSVSVGDKNVCYACMKQICSEVVPEGLEPYSENNPEEEISMFVSGVSILGRMVPSAVIVAAGNKCLIELKKQIRRIYNG